MRRIAALCAVALVVMAATATSALAAPPSDSAKAERICEKRGGTFVNVSPLVYACVFPDTRAQGRGQAARTCEKSGGLFVDVSPLVYACVLPGGTLPPFPQLPVLNA